MACLRPRNRRSDAAAPGHTKLAPVPGALPPPGSDPRRTSSTQAAPGLLRDRRSIVGPHQHTRRLPLTTPDTERRTFRDNTAENPHERQRQHAARAAEEFLTETQEHSETMSRYQNQDQ
ncbi:hypothetical protein GCM10023148_12260 [Actinokineospora soli]